MFGGISAGLLPDSPALLREKGVREDHVNIVKGEAVSLEKILEFFDI